MLYRIYQNDENILINAWDTVYGDENYDPAADFDRDGDVDFDDQATLIYHWRMTTAQLDALYPTPCTPGGVWPPF